MQLYKIMYKEYKNKIHFFLQVKDENFVTWLSPLLKPLQVIDGAYIQVETEKLTHIGFLRKGKAYYVFPAYNDAKYFKLLEGE